MLSYKQQLIVDALATGRNVLMTGPGGVGKSFVIMQLKDALVTAMTGAAAVLIGGKTLHSALRIGIGSDSADEISKSTNHTIWKSVTLLVIDEVSMLSSELLDKIECVARMVRKNSRPFGGIQLLLSGDFLQLPTIKSEFCFKAACWESLNLETFELTEIRRQVDTEFQRVLNTARLGKISQADLDYLHSGGNRAYDNGVKPTVMFCKNVDVDAINARELAALNAKETFTYEMDIVPPVKIKPENYCNAPRTLTLAVGAQVMMLANVNGLVNGSRGVVVAFSADCMPIVRFGSVMETVVKYHDWDVKSKIAPTVKIFAIPLKLAWAVTCHKAQGSSLDSAMIDLHGVFEYGQAYVAVSRVRSLDALVLINATVDMFRAHPEALKFYERLNEKTRDAV